MSKYAGGLVIMNFGFLFLKENIYIVSHNLTFHVMKRIVFILFALLMSTLVSQAQHYDTEMLNAKILKFSKMRNTGLIMIGSGTVITIGGIVLIAKTDWTKTSDGSGNVNYHTNDPNGLGGILLTVIGVGLGGAGTALAIVGTNRSKKYSKLLHNVTMVPLIKSNQSGIMLTYRF